MISDQTQVITKSNTLLLRRAIVGMLWTSQLALSVSVVVCDEGAGGRARFRATGNFDTGNLPFLLVMLRRFSSFQANADPIWDYPSLLTNSSVVITLSSCQPFHQAWSCTTTVELFLCHFPEFSLEGEAGLVLGEEIRQGSQIGDFAWVKLHCAWKNKGGVGRSWQGEAAALLKETLFWRSPHVHVV